MKDLNQVSGAIVDAAFHIHVKLGPGLLESESVLAYELNKRGFTVARQISVPIVYEELRFEEGFRADLIVENSILVEPKSSKRSRLSTGSKS
jgi:GxxExxY protein